MKFHIKWIENKPTSTGKLKADAILVDEQGIEHSGVTIWGDFPNFNELRPEGTVMGSIVTKQNGNFTNKTLYPDTTGTGNKRGAGAITKAMEIKKQNIEEHTDRKEDHIEKTAIFRDATLLTVAWLDKQALTELGQQNATEIIKEKWVEFRKWLSDKMGEPFA